MSEKRGSDEAGDGSMEKPFKSVLQVSLPFFLPHFSCSLQSSLSFHALFWPGPHCSLPFYHHIPITRSLTCLSWFLWFSIIHYAILVGGEGRGGVCVRENSIYSICICIHSCASSCTSHCSIFSLLPSYSLFELPKQPCIFSLSF